MSDIIVSTKKARKPFTAFLLLFLCSLLHSQAFADWQLDNESSSFYYVSSKASAVSEINHFSQLSGQIDENGNASLQIELDSVETSIEVRNQRVRDILFEVADFPSVLASLQVDYSAINILSTGSSMRSRYAFTLNLHGIEKSFQADLIVTKLVNNQLQVQLAQPLIISAQDFGLAQGIEDLKNLAGLASINNSVVVSFSLLFIEQ